ncbi:jg10862 [Pararge aegeria aegeria]|uniref:Jg10862 protein n=1 Tax=Pararge aegeria aegeria TaxID=348720 RepID=A0A8S4QQ06_9NEOP|nr:jg10862 [Pararge aegeria aegeria]
MDVTGVCCRRIIDTTCARVRSHSYRCCGRGTPAVVAAAGDRAVNRSARPLFTLIGGNCRSAAALVSCRQDGGAAAAADAVIAFEEPPPGAARRIQIAARAKTAPQLDRPGPSGTSHRRGVHYPRPRRECPSPAASEPPFKILLISLFGSGASYTTLVQGAPGDESVSIWSGVHWTLGVPRNAPHLPHARRGNAAHGGRAR